MKAKSTVDSNKKHYIMSENKNDTSSLAGDEENQKVRVRQTRQTAKRRTSAQSNEEQDGSSTTSPWKGNHRRCCKPPQPDTEQESEPSEQIAWKGRFRRRAVPGASQKEGGKSRRSLKPRHGRPKRGHTYLDTNEEGHAINADDQPLPSMGDSHEEAEEVVRPGAYHVRGMRGSSSSSLWEEDESSSESDLGDPQALEPTVTLAGEVVDDYQKRTALERRVEQMESQLNINESKGKWYLMVARLRDHKRCAFATVLLITATCLALTLGIFFASGDSNASNVSSASPPPIRSSTPTYVQSSLAPTELPTDAPSSISNSFRCFESDTELVNAVDQYSEGLSPTSNIAVQYGHPIGTWCVSRVSSFENLFAIFRNDNSGIFDESLAEWDMSGATTLVAMFSGAAAFNSNISDWNVSNVESMRHMFSLALSFNQSMDSFDVSKVTTMNSMFLSAQSFNQEVNSWKLDSLTATREMFKDATAFDKNLSNWDTSRIVDSRNMFQGATKFNRDLSSWSLDQNKDLSGMFDGATAFNQSLCSWGELLSVDALVTNMFRGTSCIVEADPDLTTDPPGPFCHPCR